MANGVLSIHNLTVRFQETAVVDRVSFQLHPGKTLALVGESGSGKSMTASAIMRLLPIAARVDAQSEVLLAEQDLLALPEVAMRHIRGRRISMIFQEALTALNPVMTIGEQIREVLRCHFKPTKKQALKRIEFLLTDVGIKEPLRVRDAYPHELSGGMRQRAMIAMALAAEPDILIADEPTTALDVTIQAQVIQLLQTIQAQTNMSLLFITHDLALVKELADEVVVMCQGKIVENNSAEAFFINPKHKYSKRLFDAVPSWEKREINDDDLQPEKPLVTVSKMKVYFPIRKGLFKRVVDHVKAVDEIDFSIPAGRTLALVGESGSGKTSAGRGLLQLIRPQAGKVVFDGLSLTDLPNRTLRKHRADFQMIFQDPYSSLNPRMLVTDILAEGLRAQKLVGKQHNLTEQVDELLNQVGLESAHKYRYPHEFSGGQRQRLCIARALAVKPRFIVCDEPTSALDVSVQMQILNLMARLQREFGLSYLLITHNLAVVAYLAHEVAVMYHGKIVEQGSVAQILHQPQHEYTQRLLSAVPTLAVAG